MFVVFFLIFFLKLLSKTYFRCELFGFSVQTFLFFMEQDGLYFIAGG